MNLHEQFRMLGETGLFAELAHPSTIERGCARLRKLAHDADELGPFISIIAAAGLALPILDEARSLVADDLRAGRLVAAVGITERDAGSDVLAMKTTVTRGAPGRIRLNGAKWNITNAPVADAVVVFAVDATSDDRFLTAVLVRSSDRGVRLGPPLDLIGCHGSPTGEVFLDDVELPANRVLGRAHDGRKLLELAFVRERVLAPWALLGKMERVIGECLDHVERRMQFGKALHEFQYVQEKIVSSFDALLHARHLAERAVAMVAAGIPPGAIASLAKAAAADAAVSTFRNAIEVFGSYGVQKDKRLGEYLDDALCAQIAGGTRETHKKIVFGELRLDRARSRNGRPSRLLSGESGEEQ
jgi:alkylation response protein AidB-like acyl-CoA dehydrogenase